MGAVPVFLALLINPLEGKTEEHFFLVLLTVPFPYGAAVERTGMRVAVLRTVVSLAAADETARFWPAAEEMAPDEPEPVPVAAAVSVTVTVERATVTVTGTQPAAPEADPAAPEAAPRAADPDEAGRTVT